MAIVSFELNDFKRLDVPWEKIEDAILSIGIEIEEKNDVEIRLNITPNRPDLLDFVGLLRAVEKFVGKRIPRENFYRIKDDPVITIEVTEQVRKARPYIAGLVVKNADLSGNMLKYLINFTEKFADTYGRKRKKLAIGVHNLDAINGNLVYTAGHEESFAPLNETKKMSFSEIMKSNEKGIMYNDTVPDLGEKTLYPYLKDNEKIIAMIPIINSEATKVSEKTKELFIDITGTSLTTIRNAAALLACSFIYASADVYPVNVVYTKGAEITPILKYKEIKVNMRKADLTLGVETGRHNVINLANRMGYVAAKYTNSVLFYVPPYRIDVLNDQDIIEDIAIAYGYDRIVPLPVAGVADGLASDEYEEENRLATFMVGLGYTEAVNSILTNEKNNFENVLKEYKENSYVSIADAKTSSITMLRTTLLPGLLQNLGDSKNERLPQKLFEIGRVFNLVGGKIVESMRLCVVSEHSRANFAEMRSVADATMKYMNLDYKTEPGSSDANIPGRVANIVVNGENIGNFGELHPKVLENFGLDEPIVAMAITIIKEVKYD